jgi:hypothetical protein
LKLLLSLSFLFFWFAGFSQITRRPVASPYIGLGAYSISHADVFSFTSNQASLAQLKNISAGVYGERRFLLSELNYYTAAVALPTSSGNFGIQTGYFGFSDYKETQIGLAYGRKLGSKLDIGVQFDFNSLQIAGYGNSSAINFQIGTIMHLSEKLHAGFHAYNPVGGKFGKDNQEKLASVYTAGMGYEASEKFFVSAEIQKEENKPVSVNAGMQYKFLQQLLVRGGISSATSVVYAGVGLQLKSFRLDITTSHHPQLGVTPGLMLVFSSKPPTPPASSGINAGE